jgi:hypothetical protein
VAAADCVVCLFDAAGVQVPFGLADGATPKISTRLRGRPASQIVMKMNEPYPIAGSGHHLYENGESDYAEDEDHE